MERYSLYSVSDCDGKRVNLFVTDRDRMLAATIYLDAYVNADDDVPVAVQGDERVFKETLLMQELTAQGDTRFPVVVDVVDVSGSWFDDWSDEHELLVPVVDIIKVRVIIREAEHEVGAAPFLPGSFSNLGDAGKKSMVRQLLGIMETLERLHAPPLLPLLTLSNAERAELPRLRLANVIIANKRERLLLDAHDLARKFVSADVFTQICEATRGAPNWFVLVTALMAATDGGRVPALTSSPASVGAWLEQHGGWFSQPSANEAEFENLFEDMGRLGM